ncbi:MAG: hypothetical protein O3B87_05995, partial [bacterium]|nr:hypothetical protein [bacterium]
MIGVFSFYTAHLDNHKYKGVNIDLDNLTTPPTPTAGIADPKVDPALRGHYVVRYLDYVKNTVYNKASAKDDLTVIPSPQNRRFWGIKEFEDWINTEGDYRTLDPLDMKPPYAHVDTHPGGKHTELDKQMIKEYKKALNFLRREYGSTLNYHAIQQYLFRKPRNGAPMAAVDEISDLGRLTKFIDPTTGKPASKIWDVTNRIAGTSKGAGGKMKRSVQTRLMQQEVDDFINHIFTAKRPNGKFKYFAVKP